MQVLYDECYGFTDLKSLQGLTFATPDLITTREQAATTATAQSSATQQHRPPLLINSFRDSFSTLSSRRSSSQTIVTLSPPEDGDVSFFSSGMAQRLSAPESVASEYSLDSAAGPDAKDRAGDEAYGVTTAQGGIKASTQTKGFIRLTGARMARTLDDSEAGSSSTPRPGQEFNSIPRSTTPHAVPDAHDLSRRMQQTHIQSIPASATDSAANQFWDSSRYNPGSTSQIIPSLPISTVSSAPVLRRDMSISRKSMVGEMGEYEYEDDGSGRGKTCESPRQSRPALGQRNSRIHYTRRPAPPPPPVPTIPANFIDNNGHGGAKAGPGSPSAGQQRTGPVDQRSPSILNPSYTDKPFKASRPAVDESRRPSYTQLTAEERRAKIAEDYLTKGIAAHNDTTGLHDLTESAYYFRKAAEGGSSGGCVLYGTSPRFWNGMCFVADLSPGLALRHG